MGCPGGIWGVRGARLLEGGVGECEMWFWGHPWGMGCCWVPLKGWEGGGVLRGGDCPLGTRGARGCRGVSGGCGVRLGCPG